MFLFTTMKREQINLHLVERPAKEGPRQLSGSSQPGQFCPHLKCKKKVRDTNMYDLKWLRKSESMLPTQIYYQQQTFSNANIVKFSFESDRG